MIYIQKFNEKYQPSIKDTLNQLKYYFTTDGFYTKKLLDYNIYNNRLYIELDIQSAYKEGKVERSRIKYYLKRGGFEPNGSSNFVIILSPDDLEWVKNWFSSL
jgi:hypothetical protein